MPVECVGYGWSVAKYARSALRQTLARIGMVVGPGAAPHLEHTLDLDGTVHADEASEQDVRDMFAAHVAIPTASVAVAERR